MSVLHESDVSLNVLPTSSSRSRFLIMRRMASVLFLSLALFAGIGSRPAMVHAQINTGLTEVGQTVKLSSADPREIVVRIINIALGLIGIVMLVLMLYAGFLYMTSGGDAKKTAQARKIISGAVIGLVIILSSWAITRFVIERLLTATQDGGGGINTNGGGPSGGFGGSGSADTFRVLSMTPSGSVLLRNVQVKIVFNKSVDATSAAAVAVSQQGGTTVGGTIDVNGSVILFTPAADCPAPQNTKKCFEADTDYTVTVGTSLRSNKGQTISCSGFGATCSGAFHTGSLIDTQMPSVSITYPTSGMKVQQNFLEDVQADASDDSGVATVEFFDGAGSISIDAPVGHSPQTFSAHGVWDTAGVALGVHALSATVSDIDTNTSQSSAVSVVVRPEHCFNEIQDTDSGETGLDCGGDPTSAEFCGACSGGSCSANADCSSGFCQGGVCVEKPIITDVSPLNGKPGTFVTIRGTNFGTQEGTVTFLGGAGAQDNIVASPPTICTASGVPTWTPTQILVEVPAGAASGPLGVQHVNGNSDVTNDQTGPTVADFIVDNSVHPGLCALVPSSGPVGTQADAVGTGFGGSPGQILFGSTVVGQPFASWADTAVTFSVPVVNSGPVNVQVAPASGEQSNPVRFTVVDKSAGATPVIASLDPASGPSQAYVTVFGQNFGWSVGTILFTNANGEEAIGDTAFPSGCSNTFWRDDRVVVRVPSVLTNGQPATDGVYQVTVQRPDNKVSAPVPFTLSSALPLTPGICAIEPSAGPVGTPVTLFGTGLSGNPTVTFSPNTLGLVVGNTADDLDSIVPQGAKTGPVFVTSLSPSNKINFDVRNCNESANVCSPESEQCCPTGECRLKGETCGSANLSAEYAWQTSTGLIPLAPRVIEECRPDIVPAPTPSPSPWLGRSGGDQTPVDAAIVMRFSQLLDPTTVTVAAFTVSACTSPSGDVCQTTQAVPFVVGSVVHENDTQDVVTLVPSGSFATSTTYLVTVSTNIKSLGTGGANMDPVVSCGKGPHGEALGYCFRFRTRADATPSTVGAVGVIPATHMMHGANEEENYRAVPVASGDQCIVLDCTNYSWDWYTGQPSSKNSDTRATVSNVNGACEQVATGHVETGAVPVNVFAELLQPSALSGSGQLFVHFVPPSVEDYAPHCSEACTNAYLWARFTEELDETSVLTPGNVEIRKCYNEQCVESELAPALNWSLLHISLEAPFNSVNDVPRTIMIDTSLNNGGTSLLEPGSFYRVLLKGGPNVPGGIKGLNGVPMTGLNHPLGFAWSFRTKLGAPGTSCAAERVDVVPLEKYETRVGTRQLFSATPFGHPDECSASGQALVPNSSIDWVSSNPAVADFYTVNGSLVDTGAPLPAGCSGTCLATGASAMFGKVSVCGNGKIETTDSHYCVNGTTPKGDACVLMAPGAAAGEECETSVDGNVCDQNTCLFLPVNLLTTGGTCGNGTVDALVGESCDFGPTCIGAQASTSSVPVPDFTPCLDPAVKTACEQAGGTCMMHPYRGCSANCRHLGSVAGKSTCGNSDHLGDGKDCDDGNITSNDGCSAICLHEPSATISALPAVCGNGVLEPGETCEATLTNGVPVFSAGCRKTNCLRIGTSACGQGNVSLCCGNATLDAGEDCDDGNIASADGCSSSCLLEGSSAAYSSAQGASPSFCGNGVLEQGEQCEAGLSSAAVVQGQTQGTGIGDGLSDRTQLALMLGNGTADPVTGQMSSELQATVQNQSGTSTYGLQCGFVDEASCTSQNGPDYGLDVNGCCALRPRVETPYPANAATGVCRNVQISAIWNVDMNVGSVVNNIEIAEATGAPSCPSGTQEVADARSGSGFLHAIQTIWHSILAWFGASPAEALKWCKGRVTGKLTPVAGTTSTQQFIFTLDRALSEDTHYRIRFLGDNSTAADPALDPLSDNADPTKRQGVKTSRGVVAPYVAGDSGDLVWTFDTGHDICTVNALTIHDATTPPPPPAVDHPFLFINQNNLPETRNFIGLAQTVQGGVAVPLSPVPEYTWDWNPWTTSDSDIVTVSASNVDQADVTSAQKNGTAMLTASVTVSVDSVTPSSTAGTTIKGVAPVTVLVCERPWPTLETAPFRDMSGSPSAADVANASVLPPNDPFGGSYFNFSTMYCMDAGQSDSIADDLPSMVLNLVPKTSLDTQKGILRQYLMTYPPETGATPEAEKGLQQDGIGIRILANPQHYSPEEWYRAQGFAGSPQVVSVDGYPAIQDGSTIYVAAANRPTPDSGPIYSNIYLISHNPNAKPQTLQIYDQMVKYLTFNINILNQSNVCVDATNAPFTDPSVNQGKVVACSSDYECFAFGSTDIHCDSFKKKLIRDTQRMTDFQFISRVLENAKAPNGAYAKAESGTYLRNFTTSLWSSWQDELGTAVAKTLPKDPVNHFLTCGRCSSSNLPCQTSAECGKDTGQVCEGGSESVQNGVLTWTKDANIDPQTCWNQHDHQYICPNLTPGASPAYGVSRLYTYSAFQSGRMYQLASEYEVPPPSDPLEGWWSPPLPDALYKCVTTSTYGNFCNGSNGQPNDALCRSCPDPLSCTTCSGGSKKGQFCATAADCDNGASCTEDLVAHPVLQGACRQAGGTYVYDNICANVKVGEKGTCGDGVLYSNLNDPSDPANELCEIGMTKSASCNNGTGFKQQICNPADCKSYVDDPAHPQCVAGVSCGNGRIDKACGGNVALPCLSDSDCTGGLQCTAVEVCDDGVLNNTYGHCAGTCNGYGAFCGDAKLSPGELCDLGAWPLNGAWSSQFNPNSCALDCKGPGPYCGDGKINGTEQCDGNTLSTKGAICSAGSNVDSICTTDADCGVGGVCGGLAPYHSCAGVLMTVNGIPRETQHVRMCAAPGSVDACGLSPWTDCQPIGTCGDGIKDANEACDDGSNNGDTKACTASCQKNVCGDGKVNVGIEECDNGSQNGSITCNADYNSTCLSCSLLCKFQASAGGYCGDGVKNGAEQCDGSVPSNLTCQALGYDYGTGVLARSGGVMPAIAQTPVNGFGVYFVRAAFSEDTSRRVAFLGGSGFTPWQSGGFGIVLPPNASSSVQASSNVQVGFNGSFTPQSAVYTGIDHPPLCAPTCTFGGCVRCSDTPGNGVIKGRIYDAVFQQVVPGARVSLLYKGVKVDEAYTDPNGVFTISTVNTHPSCSTYRIVVDMYQDNVCTGSSTHSVDNCAGDLTPPWTYPTNIDEGDWGGYFSYTSIPFNMNSFATSVGQGIDQDGNVHIDLFPRPESGKAYAAVSWNHVPGNTSIFRHMHVILPKSGAFAVDFSANATSLCNYDGAPGTAPHMATVGGQAVPCTRDVNQVSLGDWNVNQAPYVRNICIHRAGELSGGSSNAALNGCPVEGTTACLENASNGQNPPIFPVLTPAACQGQLIGSAAQICAACGIDAQHEDGNGNPTCPAEGNWESCWQVSYGPAVSLMNYAPYAQQNSPIKLFFNGTYDSAAGFTSDITNPAYGYTAHVVIGNSIYTMSAPTSSAPGYTWFLGDIDPMTGTFKQNGNQLLGKDTDVNFGDPGHANPIKPQDKLGIPIDGFACYRYEFQCAGTGSYCVSTADDKLIKTTPAPAMCFWPAEQAACTGGFACNSNWDTQKYHLYNW